MRLTKHDSTDEQNNSQLTPQQFQAICLLATGESATNVSEVVGVSRQTVSTWQNNNAGFKVELERRKEEFWKDARERLKAVAPKCLDVLIELLSDVDKRVRMSAAKTLLSFSGIEAAKPEQPLPKLQTADEQFDELRRLGVFNEMENAINLRDKYYENNN